VVELLESGASFTYVSKYYFRWKKMKPLKKKYKTHSDHKNASCADALEGPHYAISLIKNISFC